MPAETGNPLGTFLKDRRTRLDPAAFGFDGGRRRTPGLRREEVAQRANISPTWYTWLEQGRGGAPSADVLNRIAAGLMLTEPEREHLFMLGLGRPPEARYKGADEVTPRLQRVLDALSPSPAIVKTATWDVVAWNAAAAALLTDYSKLSREQRNILRLMFSDTRIRSVQEDWNSVARFVVGAFRADVARAGATAESAQLVEELSRASPEFDAMWRDNDVVGNTEGTKRIRHPELGLVEMEFSVFSVDGRPDLGMIVYNPVTAEAAESIRSLMASRAETSASSEPPG
ncbi:Helix-turn-helix domain-containing protein [Faunimonas pinastri]|uniref:Helix-turn-helix domain-containing protein n=1 Tax=Faunimonas pinastri TaxID=1855383 RepID=A0A1H9LJN8_9HYPH|nr:helix-turn-helix transcriptional regulator [Faunimonas pinastri]SER11711.1 Helix-turn-helix domain-containing protein [Faunimonas pinastri]